MKEDLRKMNKEFEEKSKEWGMELKKQIVIVPRGGQDPNWNPPQTDDYDYMFQLAELNLKELRLFLDVPREEKIEKDAKKFYKKYSDLLTKIRGY